MMCRSPAKARITGSADMTPAARLSAAIEVLDRVLAGQPAELTLTHWARANRYAGSGDRAAIRDLVFDALRCKRSYAALGGAESGRGLVLGGQRAQGADLGGLFTGQGHAPAPIQPLETARAPSDSEALDCPEWLVAPLRRALGADFEATLQALRHRAPTYLRVNLARITRSEAISRLLEETIVAEAVDLAATAIKVTGNARKVQLSPVYLQGLVELQDASSQAVVASLPLRDGMKVLDYCAGGGGKTLAMAALARLDLQAFDANPGRMQDLPGRAERAGAKVRILSQAPAGRFDLVLADVPCSGSGSWRRDPEGKWALDAGRLSDLVRMQRAIMATTARLVVQGGWLAYATCSMLCEENEDQIADFLHRFPGWSCASQHRFSPLSGGDGFFLALLQQGSVAARA